MSQFPRIYLSAPHLTGPEQEFLTEALQSNWIAPVGPELTAFEQALCDYTGAAQVLALHSGTAALHLALRLAGVKAGDEVICPTLTFVATANALLYLGAQPIWIDSEAQTGNICPERLADCLKMRQAQNRLPKAMIVVHLYGQPAQMSIIRELARQYELKIIEDAAEALGSFYQQEAAGTLGQWGIFSFNGNKIITTSAGGALLCHHKEEREKALYWATQAKDPAPHYQHSEMGYNYRMSNLLAALGRAQLLGLEEKVQKRRAIFAFYQQQLADFPLGFFSETPHTRTNRWLSVVLARDEAQREQMRQALEAHNIESRPVWKPMHLQPLFAHIAPPSGHIAEDLFARGLCLPSGSGLGEEELFRILRVLRQVMG